MPSPNSKNPNKDTASKFFRSTQFFPIAIGEPARLGLKKTNKLQLIFLNKSARIRSSLAPLGIFRHADFIVKKICPALIVF